ncbi:hypothetical protein JW859_00840 [bacterium]|nr:hypothetical protein [bacterium]
MAYRALSTVAATVITVLLIAPVHGQAPAGDPYVLLDAAKLKLGEGRLEQAGELLAEIGPTPGEQYIAEEVLVQQLLIDAAYLRATFYLHAELARFELQDSEYGHWLAGERDRHAAEFTANGLSYLELTSAGAELDFIRFRLPLVSVEHLADLELYSDPEILGPAVTNWDDGREGLGKGLIAGQARVALVLAAARYYDLETAAGSLEQVVKRLDTGVPFDSREFTDWLAESAAELDTDGNLSELAAAANHRLGRTPNTTGGEPSE